MPRRNGFRVEKSKVAYDNGSARVSAGKRYTTFSVRTPVGTFSKRVSHKRAIRSARDFFF